MQSPGFDICVPDFTATQMPFSITGADSQVVSIAVKPGQRVEAEPGTMLLMSSQIGTSVELGACSRVCTGESLCKVVFTNKGNEDGFVALTPNYPAKVIPANLGRYGRLIVKGGSYMGSTGEVKVTADCDCNCCSCCCGGMGFIRQAAEGSGTVFLNAGGTVLQKELAPNETFIVDTNSIVGFQESVRFGLQRTGGCCTCCFGGEGLFNTTLTGPGLVIIQSMSFEKYRMALVPPIQPPKPVSA